jgi:hypothetical protein
MNGFNTLNRLLTPSVIGAAAIFALALTGNAATKSAKSSNAKTRMTAVSSIDDTNVIYEEIEVDDMYSEKRVTDGIRIAVALPVNSEINVDEKGKKEDDGGLSATPIITLGYQDIRKNALGYMINGSFWSTNDTNGIGDIGFARGELNLTYSYSEIRNVYVRGGLNYSDIVSGDNNNEKITGGPGFQAGIGYQINRAVGIEATFVQMNQSGKLETKSRTSELSTESIELGLVGTF